MATIDKRYDVFISYAHKDNPEPEYPITQLVDLLKDTYRSHYAGEEIDVFFDADGLMPGELWENKLLESLRQSAVMIVILSDGYYGSEYCYKEWRHFQDVEIHYSLPGTGIIANRYSDSAAGESVTPSVNVWVQDLSKRQYCDISDWEANRDTKAFRQRLLSVCEQIHDRKQRLAERKKIPTNVRPHNINFTGRAQEIRDIHAALIQSSVGVITAIKGIGGIGKSTIAYEYAHAYIDHYQGGTFNFNSEGQNDFRMALASVAAVMGMEFTDKERKSLDLQCQRVWRNISQGPPALLILDNVDNPELLKRIAEYAPDRHKLHILVTSRQGFAANKSIQEFRIPPLEQSLSLDLLLSLFPAKDEDEWKAANSIALRLGGHPLALTMVGTYLANREDMSYAIQLQWIEDEGIEGLDVMSEGISLDDYAEPVPTKIFGQVFSLLSLAETRVLEYAALLPPDSIPLPWLFELVKDEFPEVVPDPKKAYRNPWKDLSQKLERLQLVLPSVKEPKVASMHRLIQDAIRQRNKENREGLLERIFAHAESRAKFLFDDDGWIPKENRWEIAPLDVLSHWYMAENNSKITHMALLVAGVEAEMAFHTEAKHLLQETIMIQETHLGFEHPDLTHFYSNLGEVELLLGNLPEAKRLLEKAIEITKNNLGPSHHDLAEFYSNLGSVECCIGNLPEAKRLCQLAIEMMEKFGSNKRDLGKFYSHLGIVERNTGNLLEAKRLFLKDFEITEKKFGSDHHHLAATYAYLGNIENIIGNLAEAKRLHLRSIEIEEKLFGADHHNLAVLYYSLGNVEITNGNLAEAKRLHLRSIEIEEKLLGADHHSLSASYSSLGIVERNTGNLPEAKRLFMKAIEIEEKQFGSDHHTLAPFCSHLGRIERDTGNLPEAKRLCIKAIGITEKHFGSDHHSLATDYCNLGLVEQDTGNLPEAKQLFQKAIELAEKHSDFDHHDLATFYSSLGHVERDTGNLPEAKRLFQKAIEITEKHFGSDHHSLATNYCNLGLVKQDTDNLPEAKRLFMKAIEITEKLFGSDHHGLATSYSNLGHVERDTGNLLEAKRLFQKAIELAEKLFGSDHHTLATFYFHLGRIERDTGKLPEAKRLFMKDIEITEKLFGSDHHDLAPSYNNLGLVERDTGNLPEAKRLFQKAIEITEKHFGSDHHSLATNYCNLGLVEQDTGNLPKAKQLFQKAIELAEEYSDFDYQDLATFYSYLSSVEHDLGNTEEAIRLSRMALLIFFRHEQHDEAQNEHAWLLKNDPNINEFIAEQGITIPKEEKPETP